MVIGKIKPTATIVAQFAAGVEIDAIQHEGKMFLPVVGMGEFSTKEEAPKAPISKPTSKDAPFEKEESIESTESAKLYTKDELMNMESKELVKILKNEFGINPDDYEGKNTNKKLRDLILDAQENEGDDADNGDDDTDENTESENAESENAESEKDSDELINSVIEIIDDFDAGKKNKRKTISALLSLADDADEDEITKLIENFEADSDVDIDEIAEQIVSVLNGESNKKDTKKSKSKKDKDLVSVEDLKVGDRVSVWWNDDNQEWFDGEVKSIKRGKIMISYDDDTEELIDPEVHTKIKRLAE